MKQKNALNLFYAICLVTVFLVYPIKNYSAIAGRTNPVEQVKKVEKEVAQQSTETLHSELLFK